mgnify:FL=1
MLTTINQRTLTFFFIIILQTVNSFSSTPYIRGTYSGLEKYILPVTTSTTNGRYNTKYPYTTSSEVMSPNRNRNNERETASNVRDLSLRIIDRPHIIILLSSITQSITQSVTSSIRKYWWCFPMSLALYPPYCSIFKGTGANMPDWWRMVNMEYITASDNAKWIIGPFLASNISYIICGLYLMNRFRFFQTSPLNGDIIEFRPTKYSMLGVWIIAAGLISTIFHYTQALGSHSLAVDLYFLDHAVAGSATLYFLDTCGVPSRMALLIGAVALVTLVITSPGYTFLHSSWHYLSAVTATKWALDGYNRLSR